MRFALIAICFLFIGCQNDAEVNDEVTGNLMEIEPSQAELDEIALVEQPQTVQDFFAVDNDIIGDDFCYDYNSISQLILYGNDSNEEWKQFEVSDNYLTAYHSECNVLLEFMTFELDGEKRAFLSQMNKDNQQFNYLNWNSRTKRWNKLNRYPLPVLSEYFDGLDLEETQLVNEYGSDNIYINPKTESATYIFSERSMLMNMGEKQELEFEKKPSYHYELSTAEDRLTLTQISIFSATETNESFVVGYVNLDQPSGTFNTNYEALLTALKDENVNDQILPYGANDFEAYFPSDTFDLHVMQQIGQTDSYWFYEKGKTPLALSANEDISIIIQRAKAYFESEAE